MKTENQNGKVISHIKAKIKSLKDEIKAIDYTIHIDGLCSDTDEQMLNERKHKIQVLNDVLISFGLQN